MGFGELCGSILTIYTNIFCSSPFLNCSVRSTCRATASIFRSIAVKKSAIFSCSSMQGITKLKLERDSFVIVLIVPPGAFPFSISNNKKMLCAKKSVLRGCKNFSNINKVLSSIREHPTFAKILNARQDRGVRLGTPSHDTQRD